MSLRFQVLFHSPLGVLFTFPSRYLSTIGSYLVFSLGRWSSQIPTGFHVSRRTQEPRYGANRISGTGLSPSLVALPSSILLYDWLVTPRPVLHPITQGPTTPGIQRCKPCIHRVWAVSVSFATTKEISVDVFSSGYLDGSVPPVSLPCAMYSRTDERQSRRSGYPIRPPTDLRMFAPPRGFSQLTTAFVA